MPTIRHMVFPTALVAVVGSGIAYAGEMATGSWTDISVARSVPQVRSYSFRCPWVGETPWKKLDASCVKNGWLAYLKAMGLEELQTYPGGRAYRVFWEGPTLEKGYVQMVVTSDGIARVTNGHDSKVRSARLRDVAAFESALAKTSFATLADNISHGGLDDCPDLVLEAIVDGRYHFVYRDCGAPDKSIYQAVRKLEALAGFGFSEGY